MESPSTQPESESSDPSLSAPGQISLDELRERMRSGEHVPRQKSLLESQEVPSAQPPAERDPSVGPTLEELRQAIREGRATGPQPTDEEIRQAVERERQHGGTHNDQPVE